MDSLTENAQATRRTFTYSGLRRLLTAMGVLLVSFPLAYVLFFLVGNPPSVNELGPLLIALLFFLFPLIAAVLRFGHYFRRFQVEPQRLTITSFWQRRAIEWRGVRRIVRRTRIAPWGGRSYKVRVQVALADSANDWINLFDSALPGADQLYAQLLSHTPHIRPKEIEDRIGGQRRLR